MGRRQDLERGDSYGVLNSNKDQDMAKEDRVDGEIIGDTDYYQKGGEIVVNS